MTKRNAFVFILIIIQPILDIITSLSTIYSDLPISAGALLKTALMVFLFAYIFRFWLVKKSNILGMFIGSYLALLIMILINAFLKSNFSFFVEINFVLKTSYYLTMVYVSILLIERKIIPKKLIYQAAKGIALIVGGSYWIAIGTKTNIDSYTYDKVGYSGWFYSANELSVITLILLGLILVNLLHDRTTTAWIAFIFLLSMLPMIGTKTAFLGGVLLLTLGVVYLIVTCNLRLFKNKHALLFFGLIILFGCMIPFTPIVSNNDISTTQIEQKQKIQDPEKIVDNSPPLIRKILSSRNVYLQHIKEDFIEAGGLRKAFGLGFSGDYTKKPKLIEMDFFDMFFSYGIIGTILLLLPLIYLLVKIIRFPLPIETGVLVFALGLCFGIALLAGHVLFAPSVMTYMLLLFVQVGLSNNQKASTFKSP